MPLGNSDQYGKAIRKAVDDGRMDGSMEMGGGMRGRDGGLDVGMDSGMGVGDQVDNRRLRGIGIVDGGPPSNDNDDGERSLGLEVSRGRLDVDDVGSVF